MEFLIRLFRVKSNVIEGRIQILDYIRGMAILLVLLHHSGVPGGDWILAFHMPMLFFISGYTDFLRKREWKFLDYIRNRFMRLMVPYFLFELANLLLWQVYMLHYGGWQDMTEALKGILIVINTDTYVGFYGRLWFLPCMFVSDLLFWFVKQLCSKKYLGLCAGMMLLLSWISCRMLPERLPFTVDTAFMATAFLILGYVMGEQIQWLLMKKHRIADGMLFCAAVGLMAFFLSGSDTYCHMYTNQYGNYLGTVMAAIGGIIGFLIAVKWIYTWNCKTAIGKDLVMWYSANSLATFPVHLMIKIVFLFYFSDYSTWYLLFAVMLIFNIPIVNTISVYFPFMIGQFKKKNV